MDILTVPVSVEALQQWLSGATQVDLPLPQTFPTDTEPLQLRSAFYMAAFTDHHGVWTPARFYIEGYPPDDVRRLDAPPELGLGPKRQRRAYAVITFTLIYEGPD